MLVVRGTVGQEEEEKNKHNRPTHTRTKTKTLIKPHVSAEHGNHEEQKGLLSLEHVGQMRILGLLHIKLSFHQRIVSSPSGWQVHDFG